MATPKGDRQVRVAHDGQAEYLSYRGARRALLVLHGFTGYPGDLRELAHRVHAAGWTVSLPRLAGHGTSGADFARSDWRGWLGSASEAWIDLASAHETVVVLGLSMGGVIATHLARDGADGLVLLAPAFQTANRLVPLTPLLKYFIPRHRSSTPEQHDDPSRQYYADEYWNWVWPKQTASLYRLIRLGRRALPHVTCPTLSIVSRADRTVPVTVDRFVADRIGSSSLERVVLEQSGHVLSRDSERERVFERLLDWLQRSFPDS